MSDSGNANDGASSASNTMTALTEHEMDILKKAWGCFKTAPEVDYSRLAEACGMTNVGSASNAWNRIKKKLWSDLPTSAPKTPSSARKRKTASTTAEGANGDETEETPTKKPRARKPAAKKTAAKKASKGEGSDAAGSPAGDAGVDKTGSA